MSRKLIPYPMFCMLISIFLNLSVQAQNYPWVGNKKVLFATQGGPNPVGPAWVKANLATVEASPFDGLFIMTSNDGNLASNCSFFLTGWTLDDVSLAGVQWTHCKHNFFTVFSSDNGSFSWFNDAQWTTALNNAHRLARAAKAANFGHELECLAKGL